jgi:GntR family transcriptional regulator/MocR family aminotransferase
LSPELLLPLDRGAAEPLRSQLERGLREAIRSGRLQTGERLPSSRELAGSLGVSRGLVQDCYGQLRAEGYLTTRVGSATRVAAMGSRVAPTPAVAAPPATPPAASPPLTADFQSGVPDLASFPRADWLWAQREACRHAPTAAFDYGDPRGSPVLREVVAGYLRRVRAAAADPEHIAVCTGAAQGLNLVLHVLVRAGIRRVAFEDPGYGDGETTTAAAWAGVDTVPVPVDHDGIDVDALAASGARAVVVTPAHQWPTGVVLAPDRVVTLSTVSKSLAPAVRLGWVLCPPSLTEAITEEKRVSDRGSPVLDQLAVAALIESGRYDRHLRRMRTTYAKRRDVLADALARHAPSVALTGLAAGFHAVAHLPDPVDEQAVVAAARARLVGLYGMSSCRMTRSRTPPQLVLGFGNLSEHAIRAGISAVGDLLDGRTTGR